MLAAVCNLLGAMSGTAVATTVGQGLVESSSVTLGTVGCALLIGIGWNLLIWWFGLPSSSSHALIGGLCGAALAATHGDWSIIHWSVLNPATQRLEGLLPKVIVPMIAAPLLGIVGGFLLMGLLMVLLLRSLPRSREHRLRPPATGQCGVDEFEPRYQ